MYNGKISSNNNNKWEKYHHEYDSKNPTFSSTLLDKINKSLKSNNNNPKYDLVDDTRFFSGSTTKKENLKADVDKIASLRRACLVEKWMDGKKLGGIEKSTVSNKSPKVVKSFHNSLLREFDAQDAWFYGNSLLSTSTSSSEAEYYSADNYTRRPRQQQRKERPLPGATCFAPPVPKPVRTRTIESKFLEQLEEKKKIGKKNDEEILLKTKSRALKIYSNLKNLKQPISPGMKLTSFINSLFTKQAHAKNKERNKDRNDIKIGSDSVNVNVRATSKIKPTSYSACTTPRSYSRSCLSSSNNNNNDDNDNENNNKTKKFQDEGNKQRTVRFCPINVILDERSRPCGQKSVFEDQCEQMSSSLKYGRSLSKKYDESNNINNNKKIEEVALDLLSGYCWDSRPGGNKTDHRSKVNEGDYGASRGVNYVQREDNNNYDYDNNNDNDNDNDDDGLSCSSSDLFELDHLNFIGNDELPVYETTRFDSKLH